VSASVEELDVAVDGTTRQTTIVPGK
jgi:hypothetical protein